MKRKFTKEEKLQIIKEISEQGVKTTLEKYGVYGENFVRNIVWQKKYAAANDAKGIVDMHDHILVYQSALSFDRNLLPRTEKQDKLYKNDDKDGKGRWCTDNLPKQSYNQVLP